MSNFKEFSEEIKILLDYLENESEEHYLRAGSDFDLKKVLKDFSGNLTELMKKFEDCCIFITCNFAIDNFKKKYPDSKIINFFNKPEEFYSYIKKKANKWNNHLILKNQYEFFEKELGLDPNGYLFFENKKGKKYLKYKFEFNKNENVISYYICIPKYIENLSPDETIKKLEKQFKEPAKYIIDRWGRNAYILASNLFADEILLSLLNKHL